MKRGVCLVFLLVNFAVPASADSLWMHNGSVMRLQGDGPNRSFEYVRPRTQLRNEGVEPGTVLFKGKLGSDGSYSGTAFRFSRQCGAIGYSVEGNVDADGSLTLMGRVPQRDRTCAIVGYSFDVLVFSGPPAARQREKQITARINPSEPERGPALQEPKNTSRLPIKVIGCTSRQTFVHWVQEFRKANAEAQAKVFAQGMQIKGCAVIAEGPVSVIKTRDLYSCVRPVGEPRCYWTLRAALDQG